MDNNNRFVIIYFLQISVIHLRQWCDGDAEKYYNDSINVTLTDARERRLQTVTCLVVYLVYIGAVVVVLSRENQTLYWTVGERPSKICHKS